MLFESYWKVALPASPVPPVTYMQLPAAAAADHLFASGPMFTGSSRSHCAAAALHRAQLRKGRSMFVPMVYVRPKSDTMDS